MPQIKTLIKEKKVHVLRSVLKQLYTIIVSFNLLAEQVVTLTMIFKFMRTVLIEERHQIVCRLCVWSYKENDILNYILNWKPV